MLDAHSPIPLLVIVGGAVGLRLKMDLARICLASSWLLFVILQHHVWIPGGRMFQLALLFPLEYFCGRYFLFVLRFVPCRFFAVGPAFGVYLAQ